MFSKSLLKQVEKLASQELDKISGKDEQIINKVISRLGQTEDASKRKETMKCYKLLCVPELMRFFLSEQNLKKIISEMRKRKDKELEEIVCTSMTKAVQNMNLRKLILGNSAFSGIMEYFNELVLGNLGEIELWVQFLCWLSSVQTQPGYIPGETKAKKFLKQISFEYGVLALIFALYKSEEFDSFKAKEMIWMRALKYLSPHDINKQIKIMDAERQEEMPGFEDEDLEPEEDEHRIVSALENIDYLQSPVKAKKQREMDALEKSPGKSKRVVSRISVSFEEVLIRLKLTKDELETQMRQLGELIKKRIDDKQAKKENEKQIAMQQAEKLEKESTKEVPSENGSGMNF